MNAFIPFSRTNSAVKNLPNQPAFATFPVPFGSKGFLPPLNNSPMIGICFNDLIILFCREAIIPAPGNTKFPKPKPFNPIAPNPLLINLKNLDHGFM